MLRYPVGGILSAISSNDLKRAELLISQGADPNECDTNNHTCLQHAITKDLVRIVEMLVKAGANINAKNRNDYTPLMTAVVHKRDHLLHFLIVNGANINDKNTYGESALDIARKRGSAEAVGILNKAVEILMEAQRLERLVPSHVAATETQTTIRSRRKPTTVRARPAP